MKEKKTILQILNLMIPPAFSVRDGVITAVNSGAAQRMISEGTQIQALLQTGHVEYAALDAGKLFLSLNLMGEIVGASVNRIEDVDIFILEDAEDQKALQAMALAAQELRQPLSNVMSAADRMFPRLPDDSDTQDQVSQMNRRLFQMLRVLGNMSDAFLWTSGAFHPELRDVQGALAEILEGLEPLADGFGTQLEYDLISGPIFSLIDTDKMERAVYNMLSNAMKFAPSGSIIKVRLTRNGDKLYLSVQDSGSGMDPALRSTAFSRYLRSPGIEDSRYGLGLGMLLIRIAATLHGGTVLLEQPANGGFRITMSIEIRKPVDNTLRSPILRVDYAGERDHRLLEFSDILPVSFYGPDEIN